MAQHSENKYWCNQAYVSNRLLQVAFLNATFANLASHISLRLFAAAKICTESTEPLA